MESWLKLSIWIGVYGFLKEYRPEDPYITQYLKGPQLNFTEKEILHEIFPVATYTSLCLLVVVFLLTDWLRYKPVILVHAFSGIAMQIILIWGRTKSHMFIMELFYGMITASEVAYYTYIYAKVDKQHYQRVTSHMRAASLSGRFISGVTSQVVLLLGFFTIADLNYLTLAGATLSFVWATTLPSVRQSIYFHRTSSAINFAECAKTNGIANTNYTNGGQSEGTPAIEATNATSCVVTIRRSSPSSTSLNNQDVEGVLQEGTSRPMGALEHLYDDLKHAYSNLYVVKWCMWCAIATCGYNMVMTYVQSLWEVIACEERNCTTISNSSSSNLFTIHYDNDTNQNESALSYMFSNGTRRNDFVSNPYNGATEAIYTLLSAAASFGIGYVKADWRVYGNLLLGVCTLVEGFLILWVSQLECIIKSYISYILFGILYHIMMTVVNSEIAKHIRPDSYALIFGINSFFGLLLQAILTYFVTCYYKLLERKQFLLYGAYFVALGIFFCLKAFIQRLRHHCS